MPKGKVFVVTLILMSAAVILWLAAPNGRPADGPAQSAKADLRVILHQGWQDYEKGRPAAALDKFKQVLAINKNNIEALYGTGLIYKDTQKYAEAETVILDVVTRAPHYGPASYTLAQIYRESNQYDKAEIQYLQALETMPGSANIIAELGMVLEAQGRPKEAAARYRDALRYVPDMEEAGAGLKRLSRLKSSEVVGK